MSNIIKNPRVTEKASFAAEQNVYVFNIAAGANKTEIKKLIKRSFNVLKLLLLRCTGLLLLLAQGRTLAHACFVLNPAHEPGKLGVELLVRLLVPLHSRLVLHIVLMSVLRIQAGDIPEKEVLLYTSHDHVIDLLGHFAALCFCAS